MFWFFGHEVCGILASWPGIEPTPSVYEGEVLTTGQPGNSQQVSVLSFIKKHRERVAVFRCPLIPCFPCGCSVSKLCLVLCNPMDCSMQGFTVIISRSLAIELVMPSNHLLLCCPLLLLPLIFPNIGVFSSESALHIRWPEYWSFSFSISPSKEYSGLVSLRIECFDLLAVQGTLKSLLQPHTLKASILWLSAFFMVQLSYPYMTTGKTIALTIGPYW